VCSSDLKKPLSSSPQAIMILAAEPVRDLRSDAGQEVREEWT
jgi:hypothetical protein